MEVKDTMAFKNEDGEKIELEVVAKIYLEEQEYILLSPIVEEGSETEAVDMFPYRVDMEDGKEVLNVVENDEEFKKLKKEYSNLLYNKK